MSINQVDIETQINSGEDEVPTLETKTIPPVKDLAPTINFGLLVCSELFNPAIKSQLDTQDDNNIGFGLKTLAGILRQVADNPDVNRLKVGEHCNIETEDSTYFVDRDEDTLRVTRQIIKEDQPAAAGEYRGGSVIITEGQLVVKNLLEGRYKTRDQYSGRAGDRTDLAEYTLREQDDGWEVNAASITIKRSMNVDEVSWDVLETRREVSVTGSAGKVQVKANPPQKVESADHM